MDLASLPAMLSIRAAGTVRRGTRRAVMVGAAVAASLHGGVLLVALALPRSPVRTHLDAGPVAMVTLTDGEHLDAARVSAAPGPPPAIPARRSHRTARVLASAVPVAPAAGVPEVLPRETKSLRQNGAAEPAGVPPMARVLDAGVARALRTFDAFPNMSEELNSRAVSRLTALVEICVSDRGSVDDVSVVSGPGAPFDDRIRAALRTWRYHPLVVNGNVTPFCHHMRLVYEKEGAPR